MKKSFLLILVLFGALFCFMTAEVYAFTLQEPPGKESESSLQKDDAVCGDGEIGDEEDCDYKEDPKSWDLDKYICSRRCRLLPCACPDGYDSVRAVCLFDVTGIYACFDENGVLMKSGQLIYEGVNLTGVAKVRHDPDQKDCRQIAFIVVRKDGRIVYNWNTEKVTYVRTLPVDGAKADLEDEEQIEKPARRLEMRIMDHDGDGQLYAQALGEEPMTRNVAMEEERLVDKPGGGYLNFRNKAEEAGFESLVGVVWTVFCSKIEVEEEEEEEEGEESKETPTDTKEPPPAPELEAEEEWGGFELRGCGLLTGSISPVPPVLNFIIYLFLIGGPSFIFLGMRKRK